MKKLSLLALAFILTLTACLPGQPAGNPTPAVDVSGTVAAQVQQSLVAQPTWTIALTDTPVVTTATIAEAQIPTLAVVETQNPVLLTLSATLGTGTASANTTVPEQIYPTVTMTPSPAVSPTTSETLHPLYFGTVPPDPPFGTITLVNRAKAEVYISLQCTAPDNTVTILEYPVNRILETRAPAGLYVFVVWAGGNKMTGSFKLSAYEDLTIQIYKHKVVFGKAFIQDNQDN